MKFSLSARPPFNFLSVVNSHGWRQLAPFSYDENTNTLYYILLLSNGRVIELKMNDTGNGVSVETEKLDKTERKEVTNKVGWMLGLDMDFSRFYAASRREPKLAAAKKRALGRVLRSPTLFEDVIKTILTTNTLWTATKNMTRKLVDEFGASTAGFAAPLSARLDSQIKRFPLEVGGRHLLDVFRNAIEGRVIFADERPAGMVYEAAELQRANVVDPFGRCAWACDHVFTIFIIEVAVVHGCSSIKPCEGFVRCGVGAVC